MPRRDNLRMQPRTARPDLSEARLVHALAEVGLDAGFLDRDGTTLSGGEKQRVTFLAPFWERPRVPIPALTAQ